jgi:hypothetical protein
VSRRFSLCCQRSIQIANILRFAIPVASRPTIEAKFAQFQNKDRWLYWDEEQARRREGGSVG